MIEVRDANGRVRDDLSNDALLDAIRRGDPGLVAGSLNELVLSRTEPERARLIYHLAPNGQYMVTHVNAEGQGNTAIADGDPAKTVKLFIAGEPESWPADHFVDALTAGALAETFILNGGRDSCVEWHPSTAHL